MPTEKRSDPTREFLQSAIEARSEVARIKRKIARLEAQAESVTSQLSGMPRSGNADNERVLAALADARSAYLPMLEAAEKRELSVARFIEEIPGPREYRVILRHRYLENRRWPDVVRQMAKSGMPYEERQIFRLHGQALQAARRIYDRDAEPNTTPRN